MATSLPAFRVPNLTIPSKNVLLVLPSTLPFSVQSRISQFQRHTPLRILNFDYIILKNPGPPANRLPASQAYHPRVPRFGSYSMRYLPLVPDLKTHRFNIKTPSVSKMIFFGPVSPSSGRSVLTWTCFTWLFPPVTYSSS